MADHFVYNAPKFFDFEQLEDLEKNNKEKIEAYFDQDHENDLVNNYNSAIVKDSSETPEYAYVEDTLSDEEHGELFLDATDNGCNNLRKSMSLSCLPQGKPNNGLLSLMDKMNAITLSPQEKFEEKTVDELDIEKPKLGISNFQKKAMSMDRLNILSQPKYASSGNIHQEKFVSMAEAVCKFYTKTPIRFRETKRKADNVIFKYTIPQSPMLLCKQRHRSVEVMSTEEREMLEYEEAKKHSFKAKPVNLKVLEGTKLTYVEKKPNTEVKPFNLTEAPKKVYQSCENLYEFHAKPVPKTMYEPKKFLIKNHLKTEPKTPKFMKKYNDKLKKHSNKGKEEKKPLKAFPVLQRTVPIPFSFEKRDQHLLAKKEKMMQKVLEETNKVDFHARPMPEKILKSPKIKPRLTRVQHGSMESLKSTKSDEMLQTEPATFKARSAKVLYIKPFIPKKETPKLTEVSEFHLNTERRANEREKFDHYIKEKEALQVERIKELEQQRMLEEQEEIARIRKEAVRTAEPIRRYKDVKTVPSKPATEPRTPNLSTMRSRNKENYYNF